MFPFLEFTEKDFSFSYESDREIDIRAYTERILSEVCDLWEKKNNCKMLIHNDYINEITTSLVDNVIIVKTPCLYYRFLFSKNRNMKEAYDFIENKIGSLKSFEIIARDKDNIHVLIRFRKLRFI